MILVWLRRDLRLADHPALAAAAEHGPIVPVFVLDPQLLGRSERRDAWFLATLAALAAELRERGAPLVVRRGDPTVQLTTLARQTGARGIWWNRDDTPLARARDEAVKTAATAIGVEPRIFDDATLSAAGDVTPARGGSYTVFTPFFNAWLGRDRPPPLPAPARLSSVAGVTSLDLPPVKREELPAAGERAAHAALAAFVRVGLGAYADERDRLDAEPTSRLSHHLRVGALSPRQVNAAVVTAAARSRALMRGAQAYVRELAWRDFFVQVLWHAPHARWQPLRPPPRPVRWRQDPSALAAWCEGRTGHPIVDAAMRQLAATGFMANRARMVVASFLVKDLLIDWREGDRWFMRQLLDGDPALNGGNWQWVASMGADAMPAFRIFNPLTQARRFDPTGAYVRRWVPELARLPAAHVHAPWEIGGAPGYPPPIVEHAAARQRALAAFGASPPGPEPGRLTRDS
jgi:deoxyribodipyrimidine photo-lyase